MITGILLWLALINPVHAIELFKIESATLEYRKFTDSNMAEIPQFTPTNQLALSINIKVIKFLYWENTVHGTSTDAQFRLIGLLSYLHIKYKRLSVGWEHHSQHVLEGRHPFLRFPHQDGFLVKIDLLL